MSAALAHKPRRQAEIRAHRQESLLRAALETVGEFDLEGATVARICERAGASRGLISHYYDSKQDLLVAALRDLFDRAQTLKDSIAADVSLSSEERIRRIAHSSFEAPVYSWEIAAAWQAFTNASRHNPVFKKAIRQSTQRSVATVLPFFEALSIDGMLRSAPRESAMGLFILIDGLWNSLATGKDDMVPEQAITQCDIFLKGCLSPLQPT